VYSIDVSFTQLLILMWKYLWQMFHMKVLNLCCTRRCYTVCQICKCFWL